MSGVDPKTLRRLAPALEAVKERDAAAFRDKREATEKLRGEIAQLQTAISEAAQGLDQSDIASHSAFVRFRTATLARIAKIEQKLPAALEEEQTARATLARSHGSVEGCARLADRAEQAQRRRNR